MDWSVIAIVEELEHQHGELTPVEELHTEWNGTWGSYFSTIHETEVPKKTFWAELICNYVDLAIPCLSSLMEVPLDYKHTSPNHFLYPCPIYYSESPTRTKYYSLKKQ